VTSAIEIVSTEELDRFQGGPIERITLREGLREVPEILRQRAQTVKILDLSGNQLSSLPEWFAELSELKVLFLSHNSFTHVPEVLGKLPALTMLGMRANQIEVIAPDALAPSLAWLTLTDNHIAQIPAELGRLPRLTKLLLAGNRLQQIPDSFAEARSLELIRLSANRFEEFPAWLFSLPALAWLAIAGNPATRGGRAQTGADRRAISWQQLSIGGELGRGASGPTFRAALGGRNGMSEQVAVKVFSAQLSSDGDGSDEIAAALTAGKHPCIVSTRGELFDHPDRLRGLVLDIVPEHYQNLAGPPSFQSWTRDVYPEGSAYSYQQIVSYCRAVGAAAEHLHQRGIVHGDLYAHNTLVSSEHALVGDFGAACVIPAESGLDPHMLERIEVRAFGILAAELLGRATREAHAQHGAELQALLDLANRCQAQEVSTRPLFTEAMVQLAQNVRC